jgi:hypothetical protein
LTGTPAAVLQLVFDWVEERIDSSEVSLSLLQQADSRLEPELAKIGASIVANRRVGTGQKLLHAYCERFARFYAQVSRKLPAGHADKLIATLRAIYLSSRACRLARTTFNDPGSLRKENLGLFFEAQELGMAALRKSPYRGVPGTSVTQELAVALLWETAAFDTLTLEQIEYFERFLVSFGSQIILKTTPGATVPYAVRADGQVAISEQADDGAAVLFIGPGPLVGLMAGIAKLPDTDSLPAWAGTLLPHTDIQTLKTLATRMIATWERKRIRRGSERVERRDKVRVTGGFENIRRATAYAAYVRGGGQLNPYDTRERVFSERIREVMVGLEEEKKQLSPVEILSAMEAIGDSHAVESWTASDSSVQGYSLLVPGFRSWLMVGGLLAIRESDQTDWHVAIVRRLYGTANARRVGVEIFRGKPAPVGIGDEGETAGVSMVDLRDSILISGDAESWLVTTFACKLESNYRVAGQHGRQLYRLTARCQNNADYQIFCCEPIEEPIR